MITRVTEDQRVLIGRCAALDDRTVSSFVRHAVLEACRQLAIDKVDAAWIIQRSGEPDPGDEPWQDDDA